MVKRRIGKIAIGAGISVGIFACLAGAAEIMNFDFVAPSVFGEDQAPKKTGLIIYDNETQAFYGNNSSGDWVSLSEIPSSTVANQNNQVSNLGLTANIVTGTVAIDLKQADGVTDPSINNPAKISFRSSALTSGGFNLREVTGAAGIVIPSGATLGHPNGLPAYIFIYAIDNAGTVELAVSSVLLDENQLQTTTSISSSSDLSGLYSTTARSNVPIRLIGRALSTQTTAGTWSAALTQVDVTFGHTYGAFQFSSNGLVQASSDLTNFSITASTWGDVISFVLSPGTWEIDAQGMYYSNGGTAPAGNVNIAISTTSGNSSTGLQAGVNRVFSPHNQTAGEGTPLNINKYVVTVTSATTYYLKGYASGSITNLQIGYRVVAKRIQ